MTTRDESITMGGGTDKNFPEYFLTCPNIMDLLVFFNFHVKIWSLGSKFGKIQGFSRRKECVPKKYLH